VKKYLMSKRQKRLLQASSTGFPAKKKLFFCGTHPERNLLFPCFKYRKIIRAGLEKL
jgi:hypothetical protein